MPSFSALFTVALASAATLTAAAPVTKRDVPAGWASGYLEDYDTYHVRYLALDCQDQHNTTFFDSCCHPLLASEDLSSRPSNCTPTAAESSSAVARIASATASSTGTYTAASSTATSTSDDSEEESTDGEDDTDSEYCDEATSVAAQVSSAQASVQATATESVTVVTLTSADSTQTVSVNNNYVAATTTSSPTSTWEQPTSTSTSTAAAETSSSSGGSSGETMTGGYATYFYQGGVAGECGTVHSDSDKVIAIDAAGWWSDYESNDNSPYCGKYITITNTNNGKSVTAMVADVCPTCTTDNSLDLSVGAFTAIASESDGMVPISWVWA